MQSFVLSDSQREENEQAERPWVTSPVLFGVLALLALLVPVQALVSGAVTGILHVIVGAGAIATGLAGVLKFAPTRRRGWYLLLAGAALWLLGDLVALFDGGTTTGSLPALSDLISLCAYPLLASGTLDFSRARGNNRDHGAVIDALVLTTSLGVVIGVFLIAPLAESSSLPLATKAIGTAYLLGDLFLLGVLARMYSVPSARSLSYLSLAAGIALMLASDTGYQVSSLIFSTSRSSGLVEAGWLVGYLLIGAAACAASMRKLADPEPAEPGNTLSRRRQAALVLALILPGMVLLADGFASQARHWPIITAGMLLVCLLMLVRILWLISTVQDQSVRLEGLVRTDGLTGAPNRRTWDYEVNRATEMAREHGTSLCIAMIDLDKFKLFNDSKGHQAGDMLLRDSVAAWTAQLRPPALLARYGGEEFALLAPGFTPLQLATVLERLRQVTPHGQTFSAGVAQWDPSTDPGRAVAAADEALYAAKRAGRDRVVIAGDEPPAGPPTGPISFTSITVKADPIKPFDESGPPVTSRRGRRRVHRMPSFEIVTQPIVDLRVHQVCAHEALARFDALGTSLPTSEVFRQAYREGFGDLLELAAIQAALDLPGRPPGHDLYVNASARALMTARMRTGLPDNLSGITIELSEDPGDIDMNDLVRVINDLRDRGAGIALDDVGAGAQEFARLAMLQPDMVKIDRTLVVGCAIDPGRTAVVRGLVVYAEMMGSLICAEGAETAADLDHLASLGVTHAQGNLLAEPKKGWQTLTPPPAFDFAPDPPISFAPATSFEPGTTFGSSTRYESYEPASALDPSDSGVPSDPLDPSTPLAPETSWTFRPPGYDDPDATSPMVIRRDPEE